MAFQPGNQFWKARSSHGRKPKFDDPTKLWDACCEYFQWVEENPLYESKAFPYKGAVTIEALPKMRAMTLDALCLFLDITFQTWENYKEKEDFFDVTREAEKIIRTQKFTGAAADLLNANIIARDLGLADKQEHTGANGAPLTVQTLPDDPIEAARVYQAIIAGGK